jgi:hypothetical protein
MKLGCPDWLPGLSRPSRADDAMGEEAIDQKRVSRKTMKQHNVSKDGMSPKEMKD